MKNISLQKAKYMTLLMLFLAVVAGTYIISGNAHRDPVYSNMDAATYPVVMMETEDGILYNTLHGYGQAMDITLAGEVITPLPSDKKLHAVIQTYGEKIKGVRYRVMDISSKELLENTEVKDYTEENQTVRMLLNIKNLLENDVEYMLEICISTEKQENIYYYTRILAGASGGLSQKLAFILNFNSYTYDKEKLDLIGEWIEPKASGDNSNYGKVNINSSKNQIGWGEMNPLVESAIVPSIREISNELASVTLEYVIAMPDDNESYFACNVHEYYRVRQTSRGMYLLNYERETDEVFDGRNDLFSDSRIMLGIRSGNDVDYMASEDGKTVYFILDGNLWCFQNKDSRFTRVFSFEAEDVDGVRENYRRHDIKVLSVDKDGNVRFMVYGYMNRGTHEGLVGAGLYSYSQEQNQVQEHLFIPVQTPYEILRENIGALAYVNEFNVFYVLLDDTLYSIDLISMEHMEEVTGLARDSYGVSSDGSIFAYNASKNRNDSRVIQIFNMEKGSKYEIKAPAQDYIRVIAFIGRDLFYGYAHESDMFTQADGTVIFPAYKMEVVNENHEVIKTYEEEGVYVRSAAVAGMRLNIYRVVKSEGGYRSTSMDQLLNRDENSGQKTVEVGTINTDKWKKRVYLNLKIPFEKASQGHLRASREILFTADKRVEIAQKNDGEVYYAYGFGRFQGAYGRLGDAATKANSTVGYVIGKQGEVYWRRYKSTSAQVNQLHYLSGESSLAGCLQTLLDKGGFAADVSGLLAQGKTAYDIIQEASGGKGLMLSGADAEAVLYYVDNQIPVIGRIGESHYVLITAYDADRIIYYDFEKGQEVSVYYSEARTLFGAWENMFIAYWK